MFARTPSVSANTMRAPRNDATISVSCTSWPPGGFGHLPEAARRFAIERETAERVADRPVP